MDIDEYMDEVRAERERKQDEFMQKCADKIGGNGDLVYRAAALFIAVRFKVEIPRYGGLDAGVYHILNHYIENVDEDFVTWLNKDDAPMIRPCTDLRKIFPEFKFYKDDEELIETVNKIYGLDIYLDSQDEYFYSLSFDFNSFEPINVKEVYELKADKKVLQKYGMPTDEVEAKIAELDIPAEIMEVL